MSRFRRRVFATPGLSDKRLPVGLSSAQDLMDSGWYQQNDLPPNSFNALVSNQWGFFNGGVYVKDVLPWRVLGEYTPQWQAAWATSLSARTNFCSALIEYVHVGYVPGIGSNSLDSFGFYWWNGGGAVNLTAVRRIVGMMDTCRIYLNGANMTVPFIFGGGPGNLTNNIIKINATRVGADKLIQVWAYDDSVPGFITRSMTLAGLGDRIPVADYFPTTADVTSLNRTPLIIYRLEVSETDISLDGLAPCTG
jgi:hypothetical protein